MSDSVHPQERKDQATINELLNATQPDNFQLAELARLKIRYRGFPGARKIQQDLELLLQQWNLTEDKLFALTREIHSQGGIYNVRSNKRPEEDWT